jgi:hypothetical protein
MHADSITVTGTYAWTAAQQALGVLNFMPFLSKTPSSQFGDPADCLRTTYNSKNLRSQILRQLRCACLCLASSITDL